MVFGEPWDDNIFNYFNNFGYNNYKPDDDYHKRYREDEHFRRFMTYLASLGVCKLIIPLALGAVGFRSEGVLEGSLAAGWQSKIGNVPKGSTFAFLQSAGAGGDAARTLQNMCNAIPTANILSNRDDGLVFGVPWDGCSKGCFICNANGRCARKNTCF